MHRKELLTILIGTQSLLVTSAQAQMPVSRVVTVEARMVDAPSTITLVGTVEPVRRSRVGSEIAGLVKEMPVRQGDFVETGGVICKLDNVTLELRLAEERAKLDGLKARHEELLSGTRSEELVRLGALQAEAAAEFERWTFEMERVRGLHAGQVSNNKEFYDTQAEFQAAKSRLTAAQAAYDLGVAGPRVETIAQAAHAVAEQQAVVDRIQSDIRKSVILAPFAGHIVFRAVETGEWIPVGGTVVEIIELSSVLVRIDAPESALAYLTVGNAARVKIDALKRTFEGVVKHVMRQADATARTFPVEVEIDNGEGSLAGGMFARATVPAGPNRSVIAVPTDSIVQREGTSYVAKVVPGPNGQLAGVLTPVSVGVDVGEWVTLTSGDITPGTSTITRGTERILPFPMPIQIVDERGTPVAPQGGDGTIPPEEGT